jgi:hypothetical protein
LSRACAIERPRVRPFGPRMSLRSGSMDRYKDSDSSLSLSPERTKRLASRITVRLGRYAWPFAYARKAIGSFMFKNIPPYPPTGREAWCWRGLLAAGGMIGRPTPISSPQHSCFQTTGFAVAKRAQERGSGNDHPADERIFLLAPSLRPEARTPLFKVKFSVGILSARGKPRRFPGR